MDHVSDNRRNANTTEEMYSYGDGNASQSLYVDTSAYNMLPRTPTTTSSDLAAWAFSPIPSLSPTECNTNQQCRPMKREQSNTQITPNSEYYFYNNVVAQDYQSMLPNYATHDWHHMYQWYCTSNYTADRSLKTSTIPSITLQNIHQFNQSELCTTSDINRCSTPELISALASISPDSEVKANRCISPLLSEANYVLAGNMPESVEKSDSVSVEYISSESSQGYQDSGYNSDMGMSPVYPYESKTPSLSSADVSFEEANKENENVVDSSFDTKYHQPQRMLIDYIAAQTRADDALQRLCETQIQSSDISSSEFVFPVDMNNKCRSFPSKMICHRSESKPVICHKMPPVLQHKPNIKKCESAAKSKISDKEIQDQMNRERQRQRHNQPLNMRAVNIMTRWYEEHLDNPYPSKIEKEQMAKQGGITITQVKSWYANKRNRSNNTKPKLQKRQMSERLMSICHQLARSAKTPTMNNADIIQQLSSIITHPASDKVDTH